VIPSQAIELAKHFEGFHRVVRSGGAVTAVPYLCPAGVWTIGFGHLCRADHSPIDMEQGERYLAEDMREAYAATIRQCPGLLGEPERRLAAVVDWTFNLGAGNLASSTMRKRIRERDWHRAAIECRRWVYGGGRRLPGLVLRREREAELLI